jgi:hypothetical protein
MFWKSRGLNSHPYREMRFFREKDYHWAECPSDIIPLINMLSFTTYTSAILGILLPSLIHSIQVTLPHIFINRNPRPAQSFWGPQSKIVNWSL